MFLFLFITSYFEKKYLKNVLSRRKKDLTVKINNIPLFLLKFPVLKKS